MLALSACAPVLGIEELPRVEDASVDTTPMDTAADTAIEYLEKACATCISAKCAPTTTACLEQSACRAIAGCLAKCPRDDLRCRAQCEVADPDTVATATYRAFDDCRRRGCVRECLGLAGAASLLGDKCSCIDTRCAKEMSDCIQSGAAGTGPVGGCERYAACLTFRGYTPVATFDCRAREPDGSRAAGPLATCILTASCSECTLVGGAEYGCVGSYTWDKPSTPSVVFKVKITELISDTLMPGTTVTACLPERCDACDESSPGSVSTMSKDDGIAELTLKSGFRGCFRLTRGAEYMDAISYLGRPINRDESHWSMPIFVKSNLKAFLDLAGIKPVKGRGHLAVYMADCLVNGSSGMRVEIAPSAPETRVGYLVDGFLRTDVKATNSTGSAAILNAPAGLVTIRVFRGERAVGSQVVYVRPDPSDTEATLLTTVTMLPSETPL